MASPRPFALVLLLLPAGAARDRADELSAAQVVDRVVRDGAPSSRVCRLDVEVKLADRNGKLTNHDVLDVEETQRGSEHRTRPINHVRDGRTLSADERDSEWKKREERRKGRKEMDTSPLSAQQRGNYDFTLERRDQLWGHPVFVLRVEPRVPTAETVRGTAWVDADRFIELKGEYAPAKTPDHVLWMKLLLQSDRDAKGLVHPTLFKVEGAAKMFFIRRSFTTEMRWRECKPL